VRYSHGTMIVQIYSLAAADDVRTLIDLGIGHFGFAVAENDVPARLSLAEGRRLFDLVPEDRNVVSLAVREGVGGILEKVDALPPDIPHLCSDTHAISVAEQRVLREALPEDVELMKAIEVGGPAAVEEGVEHQDDRDEYLER